MTRSIVAVFASISFDALVYNDFSPDVLDFAIFRRVNSCAAVPSIPLLTAFFHRSSSSPSLPWLHT